MGVFDTVSVHDLQTAMSKSRCQFKRSLLHCYSCLGIASYTVDEQ